MMTPNYALFTDSNSSQGLVDALFTDSNSSQDLVEEHGDVSSESKLTTQYLVLAVSVGIYSFLGTAGNLPVLVVYFRKRDKRAANTFIRVLAVIDFLVSALIMPYTLIYELHMVQSDIICRGVEFLRHFAIIASNMTLVAIAVERYCAVCNLSQRFSVRNVNQGMLVVLTVSLILAFPSIGIFAVVPLSSVQDINCSFPHISNETMVCHFTTSLVGETVAYIYQGVLMLSFFFALIMIVIFYAIVYSVLWKRAKIRDTRSGHLRCDVTDKSHVSNGTYESSICTDSSEHSKHSHYKKPKVLDVTKLNKADLNKEQIDLKAKQDVKKVAHKHQGQMRKSETQKPRSHNVNPKPKVEKAKTKRKGPKAKQGDKNEPKQNEKTKNKKDDFKIENDVTQTGSEILDNILSNFDIDVEGFESDVKPNPVNINSNTDIVKTSDDDITKNDIDIKIDSTETKLNPDSLNPDNPDSMRNNPIENSDTDAIKINIEDLKSNPNDASIVPINTEDIKICLHEVESDKSDIKPKSDDPKHISDDCKTMTKSAKTSSKVDQAATKDFIRVKNHNNKQRESKHNYENLKIITRDLKTKYASSESSVTTGSSHSMPSTSSDDTRISANSLSTLTRSRHRNLHQRTAKMLFLCTIIYVVSWMPFWFDIFGITRNIVLRYTFFIGNATNPLVYGIVNEHVRKAFLNLLHECKPKFNMLCNNNNNNQGVHPSATNVHRHRIRI